MCNLSLFLQYKHYHMRNSVYLVHYHIIQPPQDVKKFTE